MNIAFASKILEWLEKAKLKPLIAIALSTGILIFLPSDITKRLGFLEFTEEYRTWIGLAFFVSTIYLGCHIGSTIVHKLWSIRQRNNKLKQEQKYLHHLSPEEKQCLRNYLSRNTKTQKFSIGDGVAGGLLAAGIIHLSASYGTVLGGVSYNIQPWAWAYLNNNRRLILTDDQLAELSDSGTSLKLRRVS